MSIRFRAAPIGRDFHKFRIDEIISVYASARTARSAPGLKLWHQTTSTPSEWFARFVDTKATFDTYRKESERFLMWSSTELMAELTRYRRHYGLGCPPLWR
jgi:hypothetical protein